MLADDDDGLREIGTRAAVTEVLERFDDGRLNVVVEGRERFRVARRSRAAAPFQTAEVEPRRGRGATGPARTTSTRALALFAKLVELTGTEIEPPDPATPAALLRRRGALRVRAGAEAGAARGDARSAAAAPALRAARGRCARRSSASGRSPPARPRTARCSRATSREPRSRASGAFSASRRCRARSPCRSPGPAWRSGRRAPGCRSRQARRPTARLLRVLRRSLRLLLELLGLARTGRGLHTLAQQLARTLPLGAGAVLGLAAATPRPAQSTSAAGAMLAFGRHQPRVHDGRRHAAVVQDRDGRLADRELR